MPHRRSHQSIESIGLLSVKSMFVNFDDTIIRFQHVYLGTYHHSHCLRFCYETAIYLIRCYCRVWYMESLYINLSLYICIYISYSYGSNVFLVLGHVSVVRNVFEAVWKKVLFGHGMDRLNVAEQVAYKSTTGLYFTTICTKHMWIYTGLVISSLWNSRDYMLGILENYHCWWFHDSVWCRASKL